MPKVIHSLAGVSTVIRNCKELKKTENLCLTCWRQTIYDTAINCFVKTIDCSYNEPIDSFKEVLILVHFSLHKDLTEVLLKHDHPELRNRSAAKSK